MSGIPIWFERKFRFAFPATLYPNLLVRLRGTPPRLQELTRSLSPEQLTRRSAGKWSLQENAGHLLDLEPLGMARLDDYLRGGDILTAADLKNQKTHDARHNHRPLAEILGAFRRAREEFVDRLEEVGEHVFARVARHPRLNTPMRLVDLLYFIAEHDDHHLARIWELRRALGA